MLKKLWTILKLFFNLIIRRRVYNLKFIKENNRWYYDFKWWGFSKDNLEMVAGADTLCEKYADGDEARVKIIASRKKLNKPGYIEYVGEDMRDYGLKDHIVLGRVYSRPKESFWICPVTLFVLGRYPNYIYLPEKDL